MARTSRNKSITSARWIAIAVLAVAFMLAVPATALALSPAIASGTVTNAATSAPMEGVHVQAYWYDSDNDLWVSVDETVTGPSGTYTLRDVAGKGAGSYQILASASGYVSKWTNSTWNGSTTLTVNFSLAAVRPVITGSVIETATGVPIAGASVTAFWFDPDGEYWLWAGVAESAADGTYTVFDSSGYGAGDYEFIARADGHVPLRLTAQWDGTAAIPLNFALDSPVAIASGTVKSVDGEVIPGALVTTYWWDPVNKLWLKTDQVFAAADGKYTVRDTEGYGAGTYKFQVSAEGYKGQDLSRDWEGTSPITVDVVLEFPDALCSGSVTETQTANSLSGATVRAFRYTEAQSWSEVGSAQTKVDGTYVLYAAAYGAGEYRIDVSLDGYSTDSVFQSWDAVAPFVADFVLTPNNPANAAPVAQSDTYAMVEDTTLTVSAPGVLGNDTDPEADQLTAVLVAGSSNGTVVLNLNGSFTFKPAMGFVGPTHFTYRASDDVNQSNLAMVSITVNAAPVPEAVFVEGPDRYATGVAASKLAYPEGADYVIIATGRNWPDALGGTSLAGVLNAPLLLVDTNSIPTTVSAEITRLHATKAIILGGTASISDSVKSALEAKPGMGTVERIDGSSRYQTADKIAKRVISELGTEYDGTAFVATGGNFPDALAAAPLAAANGWPLYLANPTTGLSQESKDAMAGVSKALVLGGELVVSPATYSYLSDRFGAQQVQRLAGGGRYETAVKVATYGVDNAGLTWNRVAFTTGLNFPDALAGGVLQARFKSVMLLTKPTSLDSYVSATLVAHRDDIDTVTFLGSTGAVSQAVRNLVLGLVN